jgi:hypothetical protein
VADRSNDPSVPSLAHAALSAAWSMIRTILAGASAVRNAGETYLPRFPAESADEYGRRRDSAPWRPEFEDCVRSISAKPFGKEVVLQGEPSAEIKAIAEDVDGRGNNLHTFARDVFEGGVTMGAHGILVDFPTMNPGATKADEKAAGARPYWVSVDGDEILALRTERRGAKEVVVHLRLRESKIVVNGFEEAIEERIRVIEPGKWEVWKQTESTVKGADGSMIPVWAIEDQGVLTLDAVPFVFFATAERVGAQYVRPPLLDLANMQIELYQQLSNKEQIYTSAGSPMLSANGMAAPDSGATVEVGPKRILYAPGVEGIATSWTYVQPNAANMKEIREDVASTIEDMRRLGMQPMLPKTGSITATASGIDSAKAHTAVQSWALGLKDALEQAFVFTTQWMKSSEVVEVGVHTDFAVGLYGAEEVKELREMRAAGDLSQRTYWDELARRGVLGPSFDPEDEEEALLREVPGDDSEDDITDSIPPSDPEDGTPPPAPPAE